MAVSDNKQLEIPIEAPHQETTILATTRIDSNLVDPDYGKDTVRHETKVKKTVKIKVSMVDTPDPVRPNETVTLTIKMTNTHADQHGAQRLYRVSFAQSADKRYICAAFFVRSSLTTYGVAQPLIWHRARHIK